MTNDARQAHTGFTLVELLMVSAIMVIVSAIAMPQLGRALDTFRLGMAVREIERELQTARVKAVTANRQVRVLFNCPAAGQYRRVEVLGEPGLPDARDNQVARCSETTFPYPAPDTDPLTRPNHDGPLHRLPFGVAISTGVSGIEFLPNGTARSDAFGGTISFGDIPAGGVSATVTKNAQSRTISVNGMGRVYIIRP